MARMEYDTDKIIYEEKKKARKARQKQQDLIQGGDTVLDDDPQKADK